MVNMIRPNFSEISALASGGAYISCECGTIIQTADILHDHWISGHCDYPEPMSTCQLDLLKSAENIIVKAYNGDWSIIRSEEWRKDVKNWCEEYNTTLNLNVNEDLDEESIGPR